MSGVNALECDHCAACCNTLIIEIHHVDVVREPRLLEVATACRQEPGEDVWERAYLLASGGSTGGCPMHRDGRCSVYPTRPTCCVGFEAGGTDCQRARYYANLPPLGRDAWPTDEDELCDFIGEDFSDIEATELSPVPEDTPCTTSTPTGASGSGACSR